MSAVEVRQLPGKGRGLVTARTIHAGELILSEEPLLLTVNQEAKDYACANCLCWLERCPDASACQRCQQVSFCSSHCQQQAAGTPWVHAEATCRAYSAISCLVPNDNEAQTSLRFLIQAAAMKAAAAAASSEQQTGYAVLMSLVGEPTPSALQQAAVLQPALCQAVGDSTGSLLQQQEVAALLVKEQLNSYGLLAPLRHQQQQQQHSSSSLDSQVPPRRLRGGAIYPTCALINHECIPNVARFDALDAAVEGVWPAQWPGRGTVPADAGLVALGSSSSSSSGGGAGGGGAGGCSTTRVVMRALHELPAGTEVVQSYFPLNWDYQERQEQAQQVYGFSCCCPRCVLESSPEWQECDGDVSSDGEWETDSAEGTEAAGDSDHDMQDTQQPQPQQPAAGNSQQPQQQQQGQEKMDPSYLSIFILKYLCPQEECFGTMAAVQGTDVCECSVCGFTRTEAQFLAELEQ